MRKNAAKPSLIEKRLPNLTLLIYVAAATLGAIAGGIWAGLGIGLALLLFALIWHIGKKPPLAQRDMTIMALTALLAMAALNFQSSQPDISWKEWIKLATIFLPLLLLSSPVIAARANHPKLFAVLPIAATLGGLALAATLYVETPKALADGQPWLLAKYNRGFSYLVILSFPIMAGLWFSKRRWLIVPFILLLLIPAGMTESRASKLALIMGLPVMGIAYFWPVFMRRALALGPVLAIGWPFAAQQFFLKYQDTLSKLPNSWRARIEIWDYMSYRLVEHPLLGWGLGASYTLPFAEPHGSQYVFTTLPAGHPHNAMIQLWVELGIPGIALGLAFAFLTLKKIGGMERRLIPFALGAWVACFCLSMIAYDFWTDSLWGAFALTAFAFALLDQKLRQPRP